MNASRVEKATMKNDIREMAKLALQAASELDDEQRAEVTRLAGSAYIFMDAEDAAPQTAGLRTYLNNLLAGQRAEEFYKRVGSPEGL